MKQFIYFVLLSFLALSCKETEKETIPKVVSSFVPSDYSLLFSTTPNDYFPLLFKFNEDKGNQASDLPDFKSLLTFLKLDEKIYAFKKGKDLAGISFTISDSTTYRRFLMDNFVCEFSGNDEVEFVQTQFKDFIFYSVWNNNRGVIIQSFAGLGIDEISSLVKPESCIPLSELTTYDSKELIAYHLNIPDSIFNRKALAVHGTIALGDSSVIIKSEMEQHGKPFAVFAEPQAIQFAKGLFSGYLNLSKEAKSIINEKSSNLPVINKVINNWAGEIKWVYSGTDTLKTHIIAYEYDENFNEVEVKKTTTKPFYKIKGSVSMNNEEGAELFLEQLDDEGILVKGKKAYTSVFLTDMTKIRAAGSQIKLTSTKEKIASVERKISFFVTIDNRHNNLIDYLKLPRVNLSRFKPLIKDIEHLRATSPSTNSTELVIKFNQTVIPALKKITAKSYSI